MTSEAWLSAQSESSQAEGLIWSTGFEEGEFQFVLGGREIDSAGPLWAQGQFQNHEDVVAFVDEPVRSGNKAIRMEWRKDRMDKTNSSRKSMIHFGRTPTPEENDRWYGFSLYIPSDAFPTERYNVVLFQLHATPDHHLKEPWRQPILGLDLRNGMLQTRSSFDFEQVSPKNENIEANLTHHDIAPIEDLQDRWTDFVIHASLSLEGEGVFQVWMDGDLILDAQGINQGYNDRNGPYPSWGIYSYNSSEDHRVLYLDEIRIGDENAGYDAVAPGRADGTAIERKDNPGPQ